MITLQSVTLQRGTKVLFDNASLTIFAKQKVGLIGLNGSGKSSLVAMLLHKLQPDTGDVFIQSNIKIAHLSQEVPTTSEPAIEYVIQGDKELILAQEKLKIAEEKHDGAKISELHHLLFHIDGYSANARAAKLLNGLGFKKSEHTKAVNQFSGGWRMRLNLAQVLMCRADLLLLDEPTNYLDLDAIVWLERWLEDYAGTLLLISHDREFLDNVIQKVVHVHDKKLDLYSGNYSSFEEQRAAKLECERAMYNKQQTKIEAITKFVNRFKAKASKAKQAQSRLKALERMEKVVLTQTDSPFSFKFFPAASCGSPC